MKKIVLISLLVLFAAACSRETPATNYDGRVELVVTPTVAVAGSADIATRARISGTEFPKDSRLGLSVSGGANVPELYNNIVTHFSGSLWEYYLGPSSIYAGTVLAGFGNWGTINLYGYYPHNDQVADFSLIPFSVATETAPDSGKATATEAANTAVDYMVAATRSKDMTASGYLTMEFYHILTSLDIKLRMSYYGPGVKLAGATFEITGGRKFTIGGTYSAVSPDVDNLTTCITPSVQATEIDVTYSSADKTAGHSATFKQSPLLMIPELRQNATAGYENSQITMTLHFTDADGAPYVFEDLGPGVDPSFTFNLSDIANGTGDKGLLAGYTYAIEVSVGTYVKFSGAPVIVRETIEDDTDNPGYLDI